MEEQDGLLSEALREVDWINLGRTLDSLTRGVEWGRYDKNFIRPNFSKALTSLAWVVDNAEELAKLFTEYEAEAKEKRKRKPRSEDDTSRRNEQDAAEKSSEGK